MKRALDLMIAGVGTILSAPVIALLAIAIRVVFGARGSTVPVKFTLFLILPYSRKSRTWSATMTAQFSSAC